MKYKLTLTLLVHAGAFAQLHAQKFSLNSTPTTAWVTVPAGVAPKQENVVIRAGHTISLDTAARCANLTVAKDAVLRASSAAASGKLTTLLVGPLDKSQPGIVVTNNGTIGDEARAKDGLAIKISAEAATFLLTGAGRTTIGSLNPEAGAKLIAIIDQDLNLTGREPSFSLVSGRGEEDITYHILRRRTVKLKNPEGGLFTGEAAGKYHYQIDGILDASEAKSAVLSPNASISVNGLLKLGRSFTATGKPAIAIADSGLVDATKTSELNLGEGYFTTTGEGALMRTVAAAPVYFPVGASDGGGLHGLALSTTEGNATAFKVSTTTNPDDLAGLNEKLIRQQWRVIPEVNSSVFTLAVSPSWLKSEQLNYAGSKPTIRVVRVEDGAQGIAAPVTGLGQKDHPYTATASGFKTGGTFLIAQDAAAENDACTVYPNPAVSQATVSHPEAQSGARITIATVDGRQVYARELRAGATQTTIEVAQLENGVYLVQLQNNGRTFSTKLVKK